MHPGPFLIEKISLLSCQKIPEFLISLIQTVFCSYSKVDFGYFFIVADKVSYVGKEEDDDKSLMIYTQGTERGIRISHPSKEKRDIAYDNIKAIILGDLKQD